MSKTIVNSKSSIRHSKEVKLLSTRTCDSALIELKNMQNQINSGTHFSVPTNLTIEKWFSEWLKIYGVISYKHTTYNSYQNIIHTYINPYIGRISLSEISLDDIQGMINNLYLHGKIRTRAGLSPATLAKIKNLLSKGFQQALAVNIITASPMNGLVLPSIETPVINIFTQDEKVALFTKIHDHSIGYLIAILLTTGLRIGEALALKISDVDLCSGKLFVNKNVTFIRNKFNGQMEFIVGTPKTKSGIRKFLITPYTIKLFKMQLDFIGRIKRMAGAQWVNNDLLFPNEKGGYQPRHDVYKKHIKMQKNAGILKPKNLHSLRHTFATDALNAGVSAQNLSCILGHKNGAITLEFYGHFNEQEAYKQLCALDAINNYCCDNKS